MHDRAQRAHQRQRRAAGAAGARVGSEKARAAEESGWIGSHRGLVEDRPGLDLAVAADAPAVRSAPRAPQRRAELSAGPLPARIWARLLQRLELVARLR